MPDGPTHQSGAMIAPKHVQKLHAALKAAGLGGLKIDSMQLSPTGANAESDAGAGQNCHAVQQPDGTWQIVCD